MKKRRFEMGKGIKYSKIGKLLMAASMSVCFAGLTAYSLYAAEQKPESATKKEVVSEEIKPEAINQEEGFCYTAALTLGREGDHDGQSECTLLEDGKPLSTPRASHQEIRNIGKGKYSHWTKEVLYFSTSDNSDPRTNGRKYTLTSNKKQ